MQYTIRGIPAAVDRALRERTRAGKSLNMNPTNDMWLAALVLPHNRALHARDRHFDHLPQIVRV